MGPRNLESFMERTRNVCYDVDITSVIQNHRNNGLEPVILFDGIATARFLYEKLFSLTGGQYKQALDHIDGFIHRFTNLGSKLVVFFDGPIQKEKVAVWKERRSQRAKRISKLFTRLDRGHGIEKLEHEYRQCGVLPNGYLSLFIFALKRKDCKVITALEECDFEIAEYAVKNKCLAILAQDADFAIFRGSHYYWSLKHFNLEEMTTRGYDGRKLAQALGISHGRLPLFATLLGNDIISQEELKEFHNSLNCGGQIIQGVATFVGKCRMDYAWIAQRVFGSKSKEDILKTSVSTYNLTATTPSMEEDLGYDDNWLEIVKRAKEKCVSGPCSALIYDIIVLSRYFAGACLEDYTPSRIIIPIGTLLKKLRRSIYGILLQEKPVENNEWYYVIYELIVTGLDSMKAYVQVEPKYLPDKHPGLLKLWGSKDKAIQDQKWLILAAVFQTDVNTLRSLPKHYVVPALATRYFKMEFNDLKGSELDALISTNVCVGHYKSEDLAKIPQIPLTYRQIWMYSAITMIYYVVSQLILYIGEPVPFESTVAHLYTDGKLFHYKYNMTNLKYNLTVLCEQKPDCLKMFNLLKSMVLK